MIEYRWIGGAFCHPNWGGDVRGRIYGKKQPALAKNEMCYTGLYEIMQDGLVFDAEKYLAVLQEIPQLELLAKAHLPKLVLECVDNLHYFHNLFAGLGMCKLIKLLQIDSMQLKRLRENKGGRDYLTWLKYEKATGKVLPDYVISWFVSQNIMPDKL